MNSDISPYKLLFTIGTGHLLLGALVWLLHVLGIMPYPAGAHAALMIQGFLLSFAMGFLMTAIPRFLDAPFASKGEVQGAVLICALPLISLWPLTPAWALPVIGVIQVGFLFVFAARRFFSRNFMPPPSFILIPVGLLSGLVGSVMIFYQNPAGRPLQLMGLMLAFVLGIGAKLVSALLGWQPPIMIELDQRKASRHWEPFFILVAGVYLIGILTHALGSTQLGDFLWAICSTAVGVTKWKIFSKPRTEGRLAWCLWISIWSVVLGLWLMALFPGLRVHFEHIIYVTGMALMTLTVACRVILSHGGHGIELEKRSRSLLAMCLLLLLAMATRVTAVFMSPESYFRHLAYAALILIVGVLVWSFVFIGFIWFQENDSQL